MRHLLRTDDVSAAAVKCLPSSPPPGVGTVCAAAFSAANQTGCCPYAKAVCCPNKQTCCPSGHVCHDTGTYITSCVKVNNPDGDRPTRGLSVCKFGSPVSPSKTLPNVLVIGDSVSIGYTPPVAKHMAKVAQVVHSPFDISDGGAEETAYGLQVHQDTRDVSSLSLL